MVDQIHKFSPLSSYSSNLDMFFEPSELEKVFPDEFKSKKPPPIKIPGFSGIKAELMVPEQPSLEKGFSLLLDDSIITPPFLSPFTVLSANTLKGFNQVKESVETKVPKQAKRKQVLLEKKPTVEPLEDFSRPFIKNSKSTLLKSDEMEIVWKTRNHGFEKYLPEKLYCSMKYEFKISIPSKNFDFPFILARVHLIDESTGKYEKDSLKGTIECALSKEGNHYSGKLIAQVSHQLSYYHTKKDYSFEFQFFDPQIVEKEKYFASIRSPPFKSYARKPNNTEKRKKGEEKTNSKKKKVENTDQSSNFKEFSSCLDHLISAKSKLSESEKKIALDLVVKRLVEIDPSYICQLFTEEQSEHFLI